MCEKSPTQGFVLSRIKRAYVSFFDPFSYRLLNKILIKPLLIMEIGREIRPQPDHIITTLLLFKNFDYASKFLIRPFLKAHMGTAFIWAVEHDELRKCKKSVWKITFVRQNSTTSCKTCLRQRGDFDHTPLPRNKDACERARGGKENASLFRGRGEIEAFSGKKTIVVSGERGSWLGRSSKSQ